MSTVTAHGLLDDLLPRTRRMLACFKPRRLAVPEEFARCDSPGGRFTLRSWAWNLGVAECRCVKIQGSSVEIVNVLIFPRRNHNVPTFVADYLATARRLRLAFVDVQTPGLDENTHRCLQAETRLIADSLPPSTPAPVWAVRHSTGYGFHRRPGDEEVPGDCFVAHDEYLRLWIRWTQRPSQIAPVMQGRLARFKEEHVAHSPAADYLGRVFGDDWTRRFLNEFLYA